MNDALAFFREFIQAEHETLQSKYRDTDAVFRAQLRHFHDYYASKVGAIPGGVSRAPTPDSELYKLASQGALIHPRILFKIHTWQNREGGEIHGAYTGDVAGHPSYVSLFFAKPIDGTLKIIAEYLVCLDCSAVDPGCSACGGVGWERASGERLDRKMLGKPSSSQKLTPPTGPELADYDADSFELPSGR